MERQDAQRCGGRQREAAAAASAAATSPAAPDCAEHNAQQAAAFDEGAAQEFLQPLPNEVGKRLQRIARTPSNLGPQSRVIDIGSGTGALIPYLQERRVRDILAVDLSPAMLDGLSRRFPNPGTLGNDPGVRTWQGDIVDIPAAQGSADAIFFNAVFGNVFDQRQALAAAVALLQPGGSVVVSHPLGRQWLERLSEASPNIVPHTLPSAAELADLTHDLPLRCEAVVDEPELYIAHLQVPEHYAFSGAPLRLQGAVTTGFGRGSRDLGFPTANLPPAPLQAQLQGLPSGVYFGWAQLQCGKQKSRPDADLDVHPMVMNIGVRPTLEDAGGLTVEVHVMHKYAGDFYGEHMRVIALGFIRPEMKFDGLPALMARIRADIGIAKAQLADPQLTKHKVSQFFGQHDR